MEHLDFNVLGCDFWDLSLESFDHMLERCITASENHAGEQVSSNVDISFADRLSDHGLDACEAFNFRVLAEKGLCEFYSVGADS